MMLKSLRTYMAYRLMTFAVWFDPYWVQNAAMKLVTTRIEAELMEMARRHMEHMAGMEHESHPDDDESDYITVTYH